MIPQTIIAELTEKEIHEIDLRISGETILQQTLSLSHEINNTLLEPMLPWLDDPDFMKKHQVIIENAAPNWSEYKRRQREWTRQQKELAAQRLRAYWQEIRRKRNLRKELATLLNDRQQSIDNTDEKGAEPDQDSSKAFQELISALSPASSRQIETDQEFNLTDQIPEPNRLPLRLILTDHISTNQNQATLNGLPQITDDNRLETVAKLQTLLQMANEGVVSLFQSEPFGELFLRKLYPPKSRVPEGSLIIKDRTGEESTWTWNDLSNDQKDKIIADTKNNKIIVRCV